MNKIRLRTISEAYKEIKTIDPENGLTLYRLRCLVKQGKIDSILVGNKKRLINLDELYLYLENPNSREST